MRPASYARQRAPAQSDGRAGGAQPDSKERPPPGGHAASYGRKVQEGLTALVQARSLLDRFVPGQPIVGEQAQQGYLDLYAAFRRLDTAAKDLIEAFVARVLVVGEVDQEWSAYVEARRDAELAHIIADDSLMPDATREFIDHAFRDGVLQTTVVGECCSFG